MSQVISFEVENNPFPLGQEDREAVLSDPGFGIKFTDHMAIASYKNGEWADAKIQAYSSLNFSPAMMVFHYGQAIFEGMKAYRSNQGELVLFRPEKNAERFNKSAIRMAMPTIPVELFVEACDKLVRADQVWVPKQAGQSLYLRPFMIASEEHLGLRAANEYLFSVIASPVAPFFAAGDDMPAISIYATDKYVRAVDGGTGTAKCSGNYAASLVAKDEAYDNDCQDVLWRDAKERKYIEEMGTSNICFIAKNGDKTTLLTPELTGSLLDGITRDSILTLARERGYEVKEELLVFDEVIDKINSGEISEAFSCGTAVTISPIGSIVTSKSKTQVGDGKAGEITMSLRQELIDIQFNNKENSFGWTHLIP